MHRILLREVVIDSPEATFVATRDFWAAACWGSAPHVASSPERDAQFKILRCDHAAVDLDAACNSVRHHSGAHRNLDASEILDSSSPTGRLQPDSPPLGCSLACRARRLHRASAFTMSRGR